MKQTHFSEDSELLDLEVRKRIYNLVKNSEGIHFKEICRQLSIAEGTTMHHLNSLHRGGLLKSSKNGKKLRYFTNSISIHNQKLLSLLRQETMRRILMFLSIRKTGNQRNLAKFASITPSSATWSLNKLADEKIIIVKKVGRKKEYELAVDRKQVAYLLYNYKASFADKLLDRIAEMWDF